MGAVEERESIIEAIYGGAPADLLSVLGEVGEPEFMQKARIIVKDPRKIRNIPVADLENIMHQVAQIAGLGSVHTALRHDRRKKAQDLVKAFPDPIESIQGNGLPVELESLVADLLALPTRHVSVVLRDLLLRLDELRRHELVDTIAMTEEPNFPRSYVKDALVLTCARCAMDGLLRLDGLRVKTRVLLVGSGMASMPDRYKAGHILEALRYGTDRRAWESIMLAMWGGARLDLTEGMLSAWRDGVWGDKSMHNEVGALLAMRGVLNGEEVLEISRHGREYDMCSVLSGSTPEQCELILSALPEDFRLRYVSGILEHASSLLDKSLCILVRCGEGLEVIRWLKRPESSANLCGERGRAVAQTILSHWRVENVHTLLGELSSYRYEVYRGDIHHLALHAPGAAAILRSSGSLGNMARNHLYESFGRNAGAWGYCLELAPTWVGSVDHLASAGRKLSRGAGLRSGGPGER